jgi:type IV pilus assembly protein PilW
MKMVRFSMQKIQSGLTLIELLIAIVLSLAVLVGLSSVYVAAKQSFRFTETNGHLQEDAVFALDTVSKELRMAGYAGCIGINVDSTPTYYPISVLPTANPNGPSPLRSGPNPLVAISTLATVAAVNVQPYAPGNFIRGFDANLPSDLFATTPTSGTADSLFFVEASVNAVALSTAMAAATDAVSIMDSYNWRNAGSGVTKGILYFIISNCGTSNLFVGQVNTAGTSIDHSTTLNSTGSLATTFGTDASVSPAEWKYYYVATRTGASTPSLYRAYFNGNTRVDEEIVANVESMKLHYGENTGNNSDGSPTLIVDQWRTTAAAVNDWSRVIAVRVGLMMVSDQNNANPEMILVAPTLLGAAYTIPTGASTSRIRKEFSTTVVLRNRVAAR